MTILNLALHVTLYLTFATHESMIDINSSVWPQRRHFAGFMIGGETRTLKIFVKWSHENPFITPTLSTVLYEGPCRDLFTKIVS